MMGAFGQFASTTQFYLYGRRHFTRTGYERARRELCKCGPDELDAVDLRERVFIVTGANSGVGMQVARFLATKGASVYMVCRSAKRGEEARQAIVSSSGNEQVFLLACDLSLETDVRRLWSEFCGAVGSGGCTGTPPRLHGLVCNAGVLLNEKTLTSEGVEVTFACHLLFGTYLLGSLAMPSLETTPDSRLVVVSSGGMYNTRFPKIGVAMGEEGDYSGNLAYAYAKRGQVLLCERWTEEHPTVKIVSCHPGWTQTPAVDAAYGEAKRYLEPLRSPWQGAEGIAWLCAVNGERLHGGAFYLDRTVQCKHLSGPFFTEGTFTKNSRSDVDAMMAGLEKLAQTCCKPSAEAEDVQAEHGQAEHGQAEHGQAKHEQAKTPSTCKKDLLSESEVPIDVRKFMGRWYVLAAIPTVFDRHACNSMENYTWNEVKQHVDISFTFQAGSFDAPVKEIIQRATILNTQVNTRWALSPRLLGFFIPINLPYLILHCAADYSSTIVGVPDRSFLYVMARAHALAEPALAKLLEICRQAGYDMSKVERVKHDYSKMKPELDIAPTPPTPPLI